MLSEVAMDEMENTIVLFQGKLWQVQGFDPGLSVHLKCLEVEACSCPSCGGPYGYMAGHKSIYLSDKEVSECEVVRAGGIKR